MRYVLLLLLVIYFSHGQGAGYDGQVSSVLRSLYDADNIPHIIPQIVSLGVEYPVCYFSIASVENMRAICKVVCKTAGFQLCERSYAVIPYNRKNADKGFSVTVNCTGNEYNIEQCKWFSIYSSSCHYLLAVKCADCNESLTIRGDELSVVTLPPYSPCGEESACVWNISLQKMERKVTPVKFQSFRNTSAVETTKRILALSWVDYDQETHLIKGTAENFTSKSLEIASDKLILQYYAPNCNILINQKRVQLVINENKEPVGYVDDSTSRLIALILPLCVVLAGIATLIVCICYNIRHKGRFQEYRLDAVSSYKSLNCLTGITSPQKATVEDYLVTPWGKDYKVNEGTDEIQLGSVTKYTINRKNSPDHASERKVERSSSFGVKRKFPFIGNRKTKAGTAYAVKVRSDNSAIPGCVPNFSSLDSISGDRRRNLFSHMAHFLFPCIDKNMSDSSVSKLNSLNTAVNEFRDLEDSSLESVSCKFNSLILSFHWSDTTSENSGQSTVHEVENLSLIEIMNKNAYVTSDFSSGQRQQLSDVQIPRNSTRQSSLNKQRQSSLSKQRQSSLSKQLSSETEPVYSCRNSELESIYSCRSTESEKSCFSVTHYGEVDYSCSEAGTFISLNSEPSSPVNIEQYGSVQSL